MVLIVIKLARSPLKWADHLEKMAGEKLVESRCTDGGGEKENATAKKDSLRERVEKESAKDRRNCAKKLEKKITKKRIEISERVHGH